MMRSSSLSWCLKSVLLLSYSCQCSEADFVRHDRRRAPESVLASLLISHRPAAAFQPCGPGLQGRCQHGNTPINAASQSRRLRRGSPLRRHGPAMSDKADSNVAVYGLVPPSKAADKVSLIADVYEGRELKAELTTHEGQMRMLESNKTYELPTGVLSPKAMARDFEPGADAEILDKGFPWQKHGFLEGASDNAQTLALFEETFSNMTGAKLPDWIGLEIALDVPENLRAGLDLSVSYIKNHQLDKCEMLLGRYVLPACAARGMPWVVKAIQDYATLKMKQNRNAESMLLLEKLESMLPPHPIMLHNLGLAYNSIRRQDKAMEKFKEAVALNNGKMKFDDHWNYGITYMHEKNFDQAFPYLKEALDMALPDPQVDEITLAKIYSTCCNCLMNEYESIPASEAKRRFAKAVEAEPYIRQAVTLYNMSVGATNLYGGAVYDLSKNLVGQNRFDEAEPWLHQAMLVEAHKDGIHPTMCHYMLESLLDLHRKKPLPKEELSKYHDLVRVMLMNLHIRGFTSDGNGGVVMKEIAEFLMLSGEELALPAQALLKQALKLVSNHVGDVADTSVIQWMIRSSLDQAEYLALPGGDTDPKQIKSENWLLEGPWGVPEGSEIGLGLPPAKKKVEVEEEDVVVR